MVNKVNNFLTDQECDKLVFERTKLVESKIRGDKVDKTMRDSRQAWIHPIAETEWLFRKAGNLFIPQFTKVKRLQSIQYTEYTVDGHYDWHQDIGVDPISKDRLITATVFLNDDFEGGVLETEESTQYKEFKNIWTYYPSKGTAIVFPCHWKHRVTPVIKGIRRTLVMWGLR